MAPSWLRFVAQEVLSLLPLLVTVLVFFPQFLGMGGGQAPPLWLQVGAVLVTMAIAAAASQVMTYQGPVRTGLMVASPTILIGGFMGVAAALEPVHFLVVGLLALAALAASLGAAWLTALPRRAAMT